MKSFLKFIALGVFLAALPSTMRATAVTLGGLGDIYLGFDTTAGTGANKSVVIDIGSLSQMLNNGTISIDQSSPTSLLSSTFGSGWATRTDLNWFAFGASGSGANGIAQIGVQDGSSSFDDGSGGLGNQNYLKQSFNNIQTEMNNTSRYTLGTVTGVGRTNNFTFATSVDSAASPSAFNSGSWGDQVDGGSAGISNIYQPFGTSFYDGSSTYSLDIFNYTYSGGEYVAGANPAFYANISPTGIITVPEPSTYALLAFGAVVLFAVRRKFQQAS